MANEDILIDGTETPTDDLTPPVAGLQPSEDSAEVAEGETATSEQDDGTPDDDPKRLKAQIAGFRGRVTQQEKELKALRAEFTARESAADDAKAARAELERVRQEQAFQVQRNQAEVEIRQRAQTAAETFLADLESRNGYLDDQTRTWAFQREYASVYNAEHRALQSASTEGKLKETDLEKAKSAFRQKATAGRDRIVKGHVDALNLLLTPLGHPIKPDEFLALLTKDVLDEESLDEMVEVTARLNKAALAEATKTKRANGIAERDAAGTDLFERGGSPSLSPRSIIERWGDGDSSVTYQQVKAAEKALGYR